MANVLIRNVSDSALKIIKRKAKKNNRSIQAELKQLIEESVRLGTVDFLEEAKQFRERLKGRVHSDSSRLIAEDRRR